jgi:hypothetical protein
VLVESYACDPRGGIVPRGCDGWPGCGDVRSDFYVPGLPDEISVVQVLVSARDSAVSVESLALRAWVETALGRSQVLIRLGGAP